MATQRINIWRTISVIPPAVLGLAGALILALEGRLYETALVVVLVAFHRYSEVLLKRPRMSAEETAD
jgi:anti-sigma-K factor RskA